MTMQENNLAIVEGETTMGAGGNVTEHTYDQAPNGHFTMRQTESLIVKKTAVFLRIMA